MHTLADVWPALAGMALVTYLTRAGGLWIIGLADATPRLIRNLQHLATGVLTALVVAGVRDGDAGIAVASLAAIVLMRATGKILVAITAAAITAAVVRLLLH